MTERAVGRPWSAHEDRLLAAAVAVHGEIDSWKSVALSVPGRSNKACRKRWLHSLSPNVKKSAWSKEEDNLLLELYKTHSAKWAVIARHIPGRTDDACSKRYREALDPSLKKDDWTPSEDDTLLAAHARLGGKWGRVGQELQRSGLACRNRWRLLERKRAASLPDLPLPSPPLWPSLPPIESPPYWDDPPSQADALVSAPSSSHTSSRKTVDVMADPAPPVQHAQLASQLVDYPVPFHYSSSSLSSALSPQHSHYEKDADALASNGRQSLLLPITSAPPDNTPAPLFAPFDYESSSSACALSVGSTSPGPQPSYTEDMHQTNIYSDCPHHFHQLQRNLPHSVLPVHTPSARPVQVDHYTAPLPHEECSLSHAALSSRHPPTQQSPLRGPGSAASYFATSRIPERQPNRMPSSIFSASLPDKPDTYFHASPEPQLDVNAQHSLLATPDPLVLSEPRPGYHYAHQRDPSRARVVESVRGPDQHGGYRHSHVQPDQCHHHTHQPSRPSTTSPSETQIALQQPEHRNPNTPIQPEAGPSCATPDHYYTSNPLRVSHLVHRSTSSPRSAGMPYMKRLSFDSSSTNAEDYQPPTMQPIPRQRIGPASSRKRPDAHAPLRLSSDLPAADDPSIKPYACGHEGCWPSGTASSRASYCTSRGLSDHNKTAHPEDGGGDRPYRCGLEGCGKSWKSINGLQYHLQISKAHFQHAITSTFVSSYISGLEVPATGEATLTGNGEEKAKKPHKCPHKDCPNQYKQLSGLRYHLAHGHPIELPKQLDFVPPALGRKLAEKMRAHGATASSSERQVRPEASNHSLQGSFNF